MAPAMAKLYFGSICWYQIGQFNQTVLLPKHTPTHVWDHSMDQIWEQRGWSVCFCLLIALIYFLPPLLDAKESCLGPFVRVSKVEKTKENKDKRGEEEGTGGGRELEREIKLGECMSHKLSEEIHFLSKGEQTGY